MGVDENSQHMWPDAATEQRPRHCHSLIPSIQAFVCFSLVKVNISNATNIWIRTTEEHHISISGDAASPQNIYLSRLFILAGTVPAAMAYYTATMNWSLVALQSSSPSSLRWLEGRTTFSLSGCLPIV